MSAQPQTKSQEKEHDTCKESIEVQIPRAALQFRPRKEAHERLVLNPLAKESFPAMAVVFEDQPSSSSSNSVGVDGVDGAEGARTKGRAWVRSTRQIHKWECTGLELPLAVSTDDYGLLCQIAAKKDPQSTLVGWLARHRCTLARPHMDRHVKWPEGTSHDWRNAFAIIATYSFRASRLGSDQLGPLVLADYLLAFNHSCNANMTWTFNRGCIQYWALNDISPGEELTMCYLEPNPIVIESYRRNCITRELRELLGVERASADRPFVCTPARLATENLTLNRKPC